MQIQIVEEPAEKQKEVKKEEKEAVTLVKEMEKQVT
jgi:hypothetical protein